MSQTKNFLALDLGAESGRAMLGQLDGQKLTLSETHRFPNTPVSLPSGLHWNVLDLWQNIQQGIVQTLNEQAGDLAGVGLDTWGVDFGLLDVQNNLIGFPYHYRDRRTEGMMEAAFQQVSKAEIFDYTGIQFMPINTLYQLLAMGQAKAPAFEIAQTFLMAPDLFNYWLTGEKVCEFSIASTSQCYDPRRDDWAKPMLEKLGIPSHIFPEVIPAGTVLGNLRPALAETINAPGATNLKVIAPACHDTGSAVVAVPADSNNFVYISSGTWSLMGTELNRPIINEASLAAGMTNEGGINGTFRLLKNIMGLWLVQECRRTWARTGEDYSYDDLAAMAEAAAPFQALIDPDYPDFLAPGDMPGRIRAYCQATGQIYPEDKGSLIRVILESLALKYRFVLEQLENLQGQTLNPIYIVGGGIQNQLLCQLAADATNRQVVTGPVEATAAGNIISQAIALGEIGSLAEGRQIIRNSFEITTLEPGDRTGWDDVYDRFLELVGA